MKDENVTNQKTTVNDKENLKNIVENNIETELLNKYIQNCKII